MAVCVFSSGAEADLEEIGSYTLRMWGPAQATKYLAELEACARTLAEFPTLGRASRYADGRLRRFESGRHVIMYRIDDNGIVVARILHQDMDPELHSFD